MLNLFRKRLTNRKGFTLVELLVVVAIIGILAAIAVPKFTDASNSAKVAKIQADLRTIDSAIAVYQAKNGTVPAVADLTDATKGTLTAFPVPPSGATTTVPAAAPSTLAYTITSGRATYGTATADTVK
ncbi:MAG: competence type IV pilus major pilin ComGC [Negativicutes bacterium]